MYRNKSPLCTHAQELQQHHQQQQASSSTAAASTQTELQAEAEAAAAAAAAERVAGMQRAVDGWREQASATQGELLKAQAQLRAVCAEQERERGLLARAKGEVEGLLSELAAARRARGEAEEAARLMLEAANVGGEVQEVAVTLQREMGEAQAAVARERARVAALRAEGEGLRDEAAAVAEANARAREGLEAAEAEGRAVEAAAGAWRERRVLVEEVEGLRAALGRKDDELADVQRARDGALYVLCRALLDVFFFSVLSCWMRASDCSILIYTPPHAHKRQKR